MADSMEQSRAGIFSRDDCRSTAPRLKATLGIPYTTDDCSSCPMVLAPFWRIANNPLAPSYPMPVRITPIESALY